MACCDHHDDDEWADCSDNEQDHLASGDDVSSTDMDSGAESAGGADTAVDTAVSKKRKRRISTSKAAQIAADMARLLPSDSGDALAVLSAFLKLTVVAKLMELIDPQWAAVSQSLKDAFAATKPVGAPRTDFRTARAAVMVFLNGPWVKAYGVTKTLCNTLGIRISEFREAGRRRARALAVDESDGQLPKNAIFKDPITRGGGRCLTEEEKWSITQFWLSMSKPSPRAKDQVK